MQPGQAALNSTIERMYWRIAVSYWFLSDGFRHALGHFVPIQQKHTPDPRLHLSNGKLKVNDLPIRAA